MKKVTAYISTVRIHWVVEELQTVGVKEIMVTEFFRPLSQVSRMQFCCDADRLRDVRDIIYRAGSAGSFPDVHLAVSDFDPVLASAIPVGKRMSPLEEPRLARLVRSLIGGASVRLTAVFLAIIASVLAVGLFTHFQLLAYQRSASESSETAQLVTQTANAIETAHLEELLAVERLHRGEGETAIRDFRTARDHLRAAVNSLQESRFMDGAALEPFLAMEHRFAITGDEMFGVVTRISGLPVHDNSAGRRELVRSHADIMKTLDVLHRNCMSLLAGVQQEARVVARAKDAANNRALDAVRASLTILAGAAMAITALMWLVTRQKVSRPLHALVAEAEMLDDSELK